MLMKLMNAICASTSADLCANVNASDSASASDVAHAPCIIIHHHHYRHHPR